MSNCNKFKPCAFSKYLFWLISTHQSYVQCIAVIYCSETVEYFYPGQIQTVSTSSLPAVPTISTKGCYDRERCAAWATFCKSASCVIKETERNCFTWLQNHTRVLMPTPFHFDHIPTQMPKYPYCLKDS